MISETLFVMMSLLFVKQGSTLWCSMILVSLSLLTVLFSPSPDSHSLMLVLILLFVGGLLILLVFVCSMVYNDINAVSQPVIMAIIVLFILNVFEEKESSMQSNWYTDTGSMFNSFYNMDIVPIMSSLVMLYLVFFLLSLLMLEYGGMARQI